MKFLLQSSLLLLSARRCCCAGKGIARSQPAPAKERSQAPEKRAAKVLYEEAKSYLETAFAEFNKQKIPYDQKLEAKTKQEQKDLAAKYAAVLQTRKSLSDADAYYLGMLHHLAGNGDGALVAMRRYLAGEAIRRKRATRPRRCGSLHHSTKV